MIDVHERQAITAWNDALDADVSIGIVVGPDAKGAAVLAFADDFRSLASRVRIWTAEAAPGEPPAVVIGHALRYHAAPAGTELAPFLEAVQRFGARVPLSAATGPSRAPGEPQTDLRIHVSPHCPFCPAATRGLFRVLEDGLPVRLTVVDVESFPELAERDHVQSVPTVLVGRRFRATGTIEVDAVRAAIAGTDRDGPDRASIERMLAGGEAATVAALMAEAGEIFPAVLDLLAREEMSTRLGAMAALERVVELSPGVARGAEAAVWARVEAAGRQARGDLLYMLGELGTAASIPRLEAIAGGADNNDELAEAAREAIARIAGRDRAGLHGP